MTLNPNPQGNDPMKHLIANILMFLAVAGIMFTLALLSVGCENTRGAAGLGLRQAGSATMQKSDSVNYSGTTNFYGPVYGNPMVGSIGGQSSNISDVHQEAAKSTDALGGNSTAVGPMAQSGSAQANPDQSRPAATPPAATPPTPGLAPEAPAPASEPPAVSEVEAADVEPPAGTVVVEESTTVLAPPVGDEE